MNLKALTVALVLGSSSAAMAHPTTSFGFELNAEVNADVYNGRWSSGPTIRDHRTERPVRHWSRARYRDYNRYDQPWVRDHSQWEPRSYMLAPSIEFAGATTRTIYVGGRAGKFKTLELQAISGTPGIQQLWIQYDDGSEQAFHNLNATLYRDQPLVLTLNTKPRAIEKIVVYAPGYGTAKRTWSDFRNAEGVFRLLGR